MNRAQSVCFSLRSDYVCRSVCLYVPVSVCLFLFTYVCRSLCLFLDLDLSACFSMRMSFVCPSFCMSVPLHLLLVPLRLSIYSQRCGSNCSEIACFVCLFDRLSIYLPVCPISVCLIFLSVSLYVCLSVCLSLCLFLDPRSVCLFLSSTHMADFVIACKEARLPSLVPT